MNAVGKQAAESGMKAAATLAVSRTLNMASKKFADHTLYHLSPKGFWKKFRMWPISIESFERVAKLNS